MMQTLLISLIQMVVSFLEAAFASKSFQENDFFHNDSGRRTANQDTSRTDAKLQEAYDILELTPPVTLEEVRKQWKKLSLRYHPDRNQGSEEAHKMQQKVNEAFNRIQSALDRDAADGDDQESSEDEAPNPVHVPVPVPEPPPEPQPKKSNDKNKKQRQRQREKARRRQRENMRHDLDRELREEERRRKEQYANLNQERQKIQRETTRLYDHEQREAASRLFMDQVRLCRRKRRRSSNPDTLQKPKPKHYVMESCTNNLVLAMRLGMEEFAAEILDDQINAKMQWYFSNPYFLMETQRKHGAVTFQHVLSLAMPKVLLQRLDDDRNTLLHYAVYWERPTMVQVLCDLANRHGLLEQVFTAKNSHGHIAMDLAWVAINPSLISLMQTQQQIVQLHIEKTRIIPALSKAAKQLTRAGRERFDAVIMMNSFLAFGVGYWGFAFHWSISLLNVGALQSPQFVSWILEQDPIVSRSTSLATFLSLLTFVKVTWISGWWIYQNVLYYVFSGITWGHLFLIVPLGLLCACSGSLFIMELAQVFLFMWSWGFMALLYLPLQKLEQAMHRRYWTQLPIPFRKNPGLVQTAILAGLLVVLWLMRRIVSINGSRVRLTEEPSGY